MLITFGLILEMEINKPKFNFNLNFSLFFTASRITLTFLRKKPKSVNVRKEANLR
jgi:hypothetical protein